MLEYLLLVVVGFIAGVINTIAGGGSLLTLPMLIFLGLPSNIANGTNRIAILIQNIFSTAGFKSKGVSAYPFSLYIGISALLGSLIGAKIAVDIKGETFNKILAIVMVLVVVLMVLKPKKSLEEIQERLTGKYFWLSIIAFFFIGIYGGFIQAGTGLFILLALSTINNFSLVKSNSAKVVVAFIYTIGAVIVFALNDKISWHHGLILAIGNSSGAWFASRWSVDKGDNLVKIFLAVMVIFMAIKLWFFS
ncbi:sulfite exporter TauE/SafE family protein [Tenacibaculum geojense]|uniref:Probable membrane transporter protein n=2 Tax=Tenacibaculum TaxID=104267 RepID=A0ABW3JRC4_9FLAO